MIMLGALLEISDVLPPASIDSALRSLVKNPRWVELDQRALTRGRGLYRDSIREAVGAGR
jgi:Pyruvate/2-oxoacid:ferredoxin oxidoreductase gamma subunit